MDKSDRELVVRSQSLDRGRCWVFHAILWGSTHTARISGLRLKLHHMV